jgi:hypothetical protein
VDLFDCNGHDAFPYVDRGTGSFQFDCAKSFDLAEMANAGNPEIALAFFYSMYDSFLL